MFSPGSQWYRCTTPRATCTDSWYHGFSGARVANLRGFPFRFPPAYTAGEPDGQSFLPSYSAAKLATLVPSAAMDQSYGACCTCHAWDMYGSPNPSTPCRFNESAYGSDWAERSANVSICWA